MQILEKNQLRLQGLREKTEDRLKDRLTKFDEKLKDLLKKVEAYKTIGVNTLFSFSRLESRLLLT
jgi:predicted ribosome quality control (RQC) complex YloA/Tae2 family protein